MEICLQFIRLAYICVHMDCQGWNRARNRLYMLVLGKVPREKITLTAEERKNNLVECSSAKKAVPLFTRAQAASRD
jgi:hypothetical protein